MNVFHYNAFENDLEGNKLGCELPQQDSRRKLDFDEGMHWHSTTEDAAAVTIMPQTTVHVQTPNKQNGVSTRTLPSERKTPLFLHSETATDGHDGVERQTYDKAHTTSVNDGKNGVASVHALELTAALTTPRHEIGQVRTKAGNDTSDIVLEPSAAMPDAGLEQSEPSDEEFPELEPANKLSGDGRISDDSDKADASMQPPLKTDDDKDDAAAAAALVTLHQRTARTLTTEPKAKLLHMEDK